MNLNQHAFVCELLRHGNKSEACKTAYQPKNDNPRSIESAANRLMNNPEVSAAITGAQERMMEEAQRELKERYVAELLTVQRKRELLAQIAEGKWMEQPPPDHMTGQRVPVMVPTLKERLKAIDMDNRMDGSYKAAKQTPATEPGELLAPPVPQAPVEANNPPAAEKDKPQQTATKQPVKLPGAIYVPLTNGRPGKPVTAPGLLPPVPCLNTPRFSSEHNKTQLPLLPPLGLRHRI